MSVYPPWLARPGMEVIGGPTDGVVCLFVLMRWPVEPPSSSARAAYANVSPNTGTRTCSTPRPNTRKGPSGRIRFQSGPRPAMPANRAAYWAGWGVAGALGQPVPRFPPPSLPPRLIFPTCAWLQVWSGRHREEDMDMDGNPHTAATRRTLAHCSPQRFSTYDAMAVISAYY